MTGWPQTDVYRRGRPRAEYDALLASYELDPARPLVVVMGNTPTNAPYKRGSSRASSSGGSVKRPAGSRSSSGPIPATRNGDPFGVANGKPGVHVQEASYTDFEVLATILRYGRASSRTPAPSFSSRSSPTALPSASCTTRVRQRARVGLSRTSSASTTASSRRRGPSTSHPIRGGRRRNRASVERPDELAAERQRSLARLSERWTDVRRSASSPQSPGSRASRGTVRGTEDRGEAEEHESRRDREDEMEVGEEAERVERDGAIPASTSATSVAAP